MQKSQSTNQIDKVRYSAVVLDPISRSNLIHVVRNRVNVPEDWEIIAHHMTINLGELKDKSLLGKYYTLVIDSIGIDDRCIAAGVGTNGTISHNDRPHITIAVNREGGGSPVHSNHIPENNWRSISPFTVSGQVEEVK